MADNTSEYSDTVRESQVYVSAEIQGTLEKKGVLGNKTKTWCSLQGSTLYLQKKQGEVMTNMDLRDAHLVRKLANDVSGTQFEICIKKKSHVFICPSSSECTEWVRALHSAMALKGSRQSSEFYVASSGSSDNNYDLNVYNEINDGTYSTATNDTSDKAKGGAKGSNPPLSCKVSDYADPYDAKATKTVPKENDYYDVEELNIKRVQSAAVDTQIYDDCKTSSPPPLPARQSGGQIYEDAKSDAPQLRHSSRQSSKIAASEAPSGAVQPSPEVYSNVYSVVGKKQKKVNDTGSSNEETAQTTNNPSVSEKSSENDNDDDDEDPFHTLMDSLRDSGSPVPEFIHPLTEEDRKPLDELKQFLSNNDLVSLDSDAHVLPSDDPISSLKSYLETLNITS